MRNIPYGEANFRKLRLENNLYIDKTRFIELLENRHIKRGIFLRPRRFGKSLWISTLWHYYDEYYKDDFEVLFGDLYIGKNPTKLRNSYKILFIEFSGIETENIAGIRHRFNVKIKNAIEKFLERYNFPQNKIRKIENMELAEDILDEFLNITASEKVYLLIDEYDHFANAVLAESMDRFLEIVGKGGFVRTFYEVIKTGAMLGVFDRIFITGVTPITMDSLSSGFNIAENISLDKNFNEMCGFTQAEVDYFLKETVFKICKNIDREKIRDDIKNFYNGYLFSPQGGQKVYNATLINYFLKKFDFEECQYPFQMLDSNIATDYKNLMALFAIGDREKNYEVLEEFVVEGETTGRIKDRYELDHGFDRDDFLTLLFCLGFISIKERFGRRYKFEIPNYVIRQLYFDYFRYELDKRARLKLDSRQLEDGLYELGVKGKIEGFVQELGRVVKHLSNRDFMKFEEKHFKAIVLTLLSYLDVYFIRSESEINNKYPDIMLLRRSPYEADLKYEYLFELKWARKGEFELKKKEGMKQVKMYLELPDLKENHDLKAYVLVGSKEGVEAIEAG
jgi:hypothetical protein